MSTSINTGGSNAPRIYRDTALTNVAVSAFNGPCEVTGWNITNVNSSDVYINFYDVSSGSVTVGTTAVVKKLTVPAQSTIYLENHKHETQHYFASACSFACVTGIADSNTSAPTTAIHLELYFKTS